MNPFIESLRNGDIVSFKERIFKRLDEFADKKLIELKLNLANEIFDLDEANVQRMGRTKLIRVRIRGGKIQRRKKVSAVKGYAIRGGKLTRMSAQERRHRKMGARKAKFKRRAKMGQALRKRKRSLMKRRAMGL